MDIEIDMSSNKYFQQLKMIRMCFFIRLEMVYKEDTL